MLITSTSMRKITNNVRRVSWRVLQLTLKRQSLCLSDFVHFKSFYVLSCLSLADGASKWTKSKVSKEF